MTQKSVEEKLDRVIGAMVTREDLRQLEERMDAKTDERIDRVMTGIDALAKSNNDLLYEYVSLKNQVARLEAER